MNHYPGAQARGIEVGAPAKDARPPILMDVLVVGLKQPDGQVMIEKRRLVVHAAAYRQQRSPLVGLMLRTAHASPAYQPMHEGGEIGGRKPGNQPARNGVRPTVAGGVIRKQVVTGGLHLAAHILVEKIGSAPDDALVHSLECLRQSRDSIPLKDVHGPFGRQVAIPGEDIPPRRGIR